jgi:cytochrome c553
MRRICKLVLAAAAIVLSPAIPAASSVQQEYLDAIRARADATRGAQLFGSCAACHGGDAGGGADGLIPRLAGQLPQVIIRQLVDYRHDKRRDPRMEPVAHAQALRDAQAIADVAAFAATLVPRVPAGTGDGTYLDAGRGMYAARCAACHGAAGQGDREGVVPRLAGQHYAYLLRQFHDALEGRRPALAVTHEPLLQDLDRAALQGMADLLSRAGAVAR